MFNQVQLLCSRGFQTSVITRKDEPGKVTVVESIKAGHIEELPQKFPDMPKHKNNFLDKIYLVWSGHYKSYKDVPKQVDYQTIHKAKGWARIRVNLTTMAIGVALCLTMMYLGARDARSGKSLVTDNLEFHQRYKQEYEAKHHQDEGK